MKKVLILVLSSDFHPYDKMIQTSIETWDSVEIEGVETVFYCGRSDKPNTDKVVYMPVGNGLFDIGKKSLLAYEWALQNKKFDYIARVNASCYVNKKNLIKFVQDLPDSNVFFGAEVTGAERRYYWGGCQYLLSKDVLQKVVDNKANWNHSKMEDVSLSYIIDDLNVPCTPAKSCSIDNMGNCWRCMIYGGGESFEFTDFRDINKAEGQFFFRIKQDKDRGQDAFVMNQLFNVLQ